MNWHNRTLTENQHFSQGQQLPPSAMQRAVYNRLAHISDMKLAVFDSISFETSNHCNCNSGAPYTRGQVGLLKLSSM